MDCSLYQYKVTFFVSSNFGLKSTLSDTSVATPACFYAAYAWKIFLHPFALKPMFVFGSEVHFLGTTNIWVLIFNLVHQSVSFNWRIEIIYVQHYYKGHFVLFVMFECRDTLN
jgi:hypothetical protein